MNNIVLAIMHGLILGGSYGLIAVGLSVIFGVVRIINFAHGSLLMVAAFMYYVFFSHFNMDPFLTMIIGVPLFFALGFLLQRFLIKPLLVRESASVLEPTSVMLFTIGLDYALMNLFLMIFSAKTRTVSTWSYKNYFKLFGGAFVTQYARLITFVLAFVVAFVLWFIINRTELGKQIRSVAQNRDAAALCGIDIYKTYAIAFGLGMAAVSVAAASVVSFYQVSPSMGQVYGTKAFMVVVLGGLGSIPGAIVGGLIFGLIESVGAQFITSSMASMLSFAVFLIVLVVKPTGIMIKGKKA